MKWREWQRWRTMAYIAQCTRAYSDLIVRFSFFVSAQPSHPMHAHFRTSTVWSDTNLSRHTCNASCPLCVYLCRHNTFVSVRVLTKKASEKYRSWSFVLFSPGRRQGEQSRRKMILFLFSGPLSVCPFFFQPASRHIAECMLLKYAVMH